MPSFPEYTAEENLLRILMDKNTRYLLVEGPFDMPIFSEIVSIIVDKNRSITEPVTVYGGGKNIILEWNKYYNPKNTAIILDMDFDHQTLELESDNIIPLQKYSIENYFFDENVASPLIANLLTKNLRDVSENLSFDELRFHWSTELSELLHVLFYYQKIYAGDKSKWNSYFINQESGRWQICTIKVLTLKNSILTEMNKNYEDCRTEFLKMYPNFCCPCTYFPGKILMESFHRYLKSTCNSEKKGAYSTITNPKSLISNLAGRLVRNKDLEQLITKAIA